MKPSIITLPTLKFNSLSGFITSVKAKLPRKNTEGFIKPPAKDRRIFYDAVRAVFQNDLCKAQALAAAVNYRLAKLNDTGAKRIYAVLVENTSGFRALGTYIFDLNFARNLITEVPHPLADAVTLEEGAAIFQATNARALFIAGTHRCANAETSPCSGTTTVCNEGVSGKFKISDAGHYTENFFQEAHRASLGLRDKIPTAISLHGNDVDSLPDIVLSNGTTNEAASNSRVNRLRQQLKNLGASAGSCNFPGDGNLSLCGTTNVQGRLSNGSTLSPCKINAASASGLFLHIEQHLDIRENPSRLINALKTVIPARKNKACLSPAK
ncbi:MAG TPA: hypothetical protein VGC97_03505 [Pyrinomonadaceae bacterium]|jgi:hypothetical protein